jgi:predicted nucleic acid-binding protein
MPTNDPNRIYWDSCVFLSVLNKNPTRHQTLRTILDEVRASHGTLKIYTSTISIAEVAFLVQEKNQRQLDSQTLSNIDGLLGDRTIIEMVEANQRVMTMARDYIREAMANHHRFKPADAIHLATAVFARSGKFHTYNVGDFKPMEQILSIGIQVMIPAPLTLGPLFEGSSP